MNEIQKSIWRRSLVILLASALALFLTLPFLPASASAVNEDTVYAGAEAEAGQSAGLEGENDTASETSHDAVDEDALEEEPPAVIRQEAAADFGAATRSGGDGAAEDEAWEVTSLDISKDVDLVEAADPEIGLEKTASDGYLEMAVGEKKEVTFTIEVTAAQGDAYYIEGNIFVQNTGDWPADVVAVSDTVWYKYGGPDWILVPSNIATTVPLGDDAIPTGGPHVYSYAGTFTLPVPLSGVDAMSNLIEITISNKPDPPKPGMQDWTFHYREDFAKPAAAGEQSVSLEDIESMSPDTGLSYEIKSVTINGSPAVSLTGPWSLDLASAPYTLVITKELTAESAGSYVLHNKARIGELEDEAEVEILVKEEEGERLGSIEGHKYVDLDADGEFDDGENGLEGVTIKLYRIYEYNSNLEVAATTLALSLVGQTETDANGHFSFADLEFGKYLVAEEVPEGYYATSANPVEVSVDSEEAAEVVFLNAPYASVTGTKWLDLNANGTADAGESGLEEVTILLLDADGMLVASTKSAAGGGYSFTGLKPGRYTVQEVVPFGYEATAPTAVTFDLLPGEKKRVDFFNRVPVGGEVVTPPVDTGIQAGAQQTLPATGFDVVYLLIVVGFLLVAGALLASLGARRMSMR